MNNKIIPFAHPRRVRKEVRSEACAWLVEVDAGLSTEGLERLDRWLAEDPEHARALLAMAKIWDQMAVLAELSHLFPLEQFPLVQNDAASEHRASRKRFAASAVASAGLVLAIVVWAGVHQSSSIEEQSAQQAYETAVGEQLTVPLPDRSEVILNTDTAVHVMYSEARREILLERGEAYFRIAREAERPFRVRAGARVVEVVGTVFTVQKTRPDSVEVTVVEGRVNVLRAIELPLHERLSSSPDPAARDHAPESLSVSLVAGEQVTVSDDQPGPIEKIRVDPEKVEARLAWRHGMLLFQGDSLQSVLREVSRYTTTRIEADAAIRDISVSGYFPAGDIDKLLSAMQENFQLNVRRMRDDRILLTAEEPKDR